MRIEQTARVFGLALALTVSACGSVLQSPDSGTDSRTDTGNDGGGVACRQLGEADCRARTDCAVGIVHGRLRWRVVLRRLLRPGERDAAPVRRPRHRAARRRARR